MKTYYIVDNETNKIVDVISDPAFNPLKVVHKFGADKERRLLREIKIPVSYNPLTHSQKIVRKVRPNWVRLLYVNTPLPNDVVKANLEGKATELIGMVLPSWKQNNFLARAIEINKNKASRPLTAEETAQEAALDATWAWATAVRTNAELLYQQHVGGAKIDTDLGWPSAPDFLKNGG